jgi:hypothetical protein
MDDKRERRMFYPHYTAVSGKPSGALLCLGIAVRTMPVSASSSPNRHNCPLLADASVTGAARYYRLDENRV